MDYELFRNINLSLVKELKDIVPSGVDVVDETATSMDTNTIVVFYVDIFHRPFEMGNADDQDILLFSSEIYANDIQQRDYLTFLVYDKLKDWTISLKDFSSNGETIGSLYISKPEGRPIRQPLEINDKMKFVASITFQVAFQEA